MMWCLGGGTPWRSLRKVLCCEIGWWTSWTNRRARAVLRGSILLFKQNRLGKPRPKQQYTSI